MKISIITSVYNNESTLEQAIKSVLSQSYSDIEYIVIDGGSTDKTPQIINKYKNKISKIISEPDKGIYDGLNKGIKLATGDAIAFLHSDDIYEDEHVIQKVVDEFANKSVDAVYGDLVYVKKDDDRSIVRYWKSCLFKRNKMKLGWMPPHPTLFIKKEIYKKYGLFDLEYSISADYELILRFFWKYQITSSYIPSVLNRMRFGGASNRSLLNIMKKSLEDLRAIRCYKVGVFSVLVFKNVLKISQYFIKRKSV